MSWHDNDEPHPDLLLAAQMQAFVLALDALIDVAEEHVPALRARFHAKLSRNRAAIVEHATGPLHEAVARLLSLILQYSRGN